MINILNHIDLSIHTEGSTFGTFIPATYTIDQSKKLAEMIDEILSPNDSYGWASNGIYFFWNWETKEILYIGLAVDLKERFRQHNGLSTSTIRSSKFKEINTYFKENIKIGYTVFVQRAESQTKSYRNKQEFSEVKNFDEIQNLEQRKILNIFEGLFLQQFINHHGELPVWNKIKSNPFGAKLACKNIFDDFENQVVSVPYAPFTSNSTIQELAINPQYTYYEWILSNIRSWMIYTGITFEEGIKKVIEEDKTGLRKSTLLKLISTNYINKVPNL